MSPTIVKQISFVHGSDNKFLDRLFVSGEGYYDFTYNRQDGDTKPKAIDWWGYFNGTINQTSNLPSVSLDLVKKKYLMAHQPNLALGMQPIVSRKKVVWWQSL